MHAISARHRRLAALPAIAALTITLAACGDDGENNNADTDQNDAPVAETDEGEETGAGDEPDGGDAGDDAEDDATDDAASDDDAAAAGDSDGELVIYSGRDLELVQPIIDEFEAETGITVEVRDGNTAELAAQIINEGDGTPADVFFGQDAGALGALSQAGALDQLPTETLDLVPEAYRSAAGDWIGVSGRARVLIYSDQDVDEAELPDSVFDLSDPEWSGRFGIAPTNASFQAFVTALRIEHGEDVAQEWLNDIAANDPVIYDGNGPMITDVWEGALDVGLTNHYYIWARAAESGENVEDLNVQVHWFPGGDTGGLINVAGAALTANQTDGDGAAFIEYLLSQSGQEYFGETTGEYPLVTGVEASEGLPAIEELEIPDIDLNDLADLQTTVEMITEAGLA